MRKVMMRRGEAGNGDTRKAWKKEGREEGKQKTEESNEGGRIRRGAGGSENKRVGWWE